MTQHKVAIVTGSATGIGAATALALAARGYDMVINYSKSEAEAKASVEACRREGADTLLMRGDVAVEEDCREMVRSAIERWGRIDALVNNAGITSLTGANDWDAVDAQTFHRIVAVNALGTLQMIRACAEPLRATGGAIVNVSSIAGALGNGSSVAYVASKGAVNSMTLFFARALAPEVRVNAVCPGLVTTRWFATGVGREGYEKIKASYEKNAPLARASTPADVAEAVVWLIEGARTMTGELLMLDSGVHLGASPGRSPGDRQA